MYSELLIRAREEGHLYIEGIVDKAGAHGVYLFFPSSGSSEILLIDLQDRKKFLKELFEDATVEKVFFGCKSLFAIGLQSFEHAKRICDVDILCGCEMELAEIVRRELSEDDYSSLLEAAMKFDAHITAAEVARIPLKQISVKSLMPHGFFEGFYRTRAVRTLALRAKRYQNKSYSLSDEPGLLNRVAIALAGPEVDGFKHCDKIVYPKFNVVGGKTSRISIRKGSFNCMSIQKGSAREQITSRFEDGKVVSFDFNAIDYRCIVSVIPKLRDLYNDCDDFHVRTIEIVTGKKSDNKDIRDVFKALTYVHFYGGSVETCQKMTKLPLAKVEQLLSLMEEKLVGINDLKETFWNGFMVSLPKDMVSRPNIELGMHRGAKLAYFAQTCSSHVFKSSLAALCEEMARRNMKSKLMFPVHDEALIDCHSDEVDQLDSLSKVMEQAATECMNLRFAVKKKIGKSYGDM